MPLTTLNNEEIAQPVYQAKSEFQSRHAQEGINNAPVVVNVAASAGGGHVSFSFVHWSYDADPTGGLLTITSGDLTYTMHITSGGPGFLPFEGVAFPANTAVTATLAAGGGTVEGSLALIGVRYV